MQSQHAAYEAVDELEITDVEVNDLVAADPIVGRMLYEVIGQFQQSGIDVRFGRALVVGEYAAELGQGQWLIGCQKQALEDALQRCAGGIANPYHGYSS